MSVRLRWPTPYSFFLLYVACLILLPSGTLLGVPVKILVVLPGTFYALRIVGRQPNGFHEIALCIAMLGVFMAWVLLAQMYAFYNMGLSLSQYRDVVTTLAGCWFIRVFTPTEERRTAFIRFCVMTVAFGALIKVFIFAYSLARGISIASIMDAISHVFGVQLMTFELGDAGYRIQYPSDTLVPVCLFAVLCLRRRLRLAGLLSFPIVLLLTLSSIATFSRFLWGYALLAAVLGVLLAKRDRTHFAYFAASLAIVAVYAKLLLTIVALRFSADTLTASDGERIAQKNALEHFFLDAPLLGHGLGSYTNAVIRAPELRYNYEMQVYALAGQIGSIGILILLVLLGNYFRKAIRPQAQSRPYQVAVLGLLAGFLSAGFVNPSLISSIAAATFGLLYVLASIDSAGRASVPVVSPESQLRAIGASLAQAP